MHSSPFSIHLSLEELAVIFSLIGRTELAKSMLVGNLGEMSPDEERGRLLAANHTLIAKDILDVEDDKPRLSPKLNRMVNALVEQKFLLRCSRKVNGVEQILAYYFQDDLIVKHQISHAIVHHFSEITETEGVLVESLEFLTFSEVENFDCPEGELSQQSLEEVREHARGSLEAAKIFLREANIPERTSRLFAQDLHQETDRGSVLRVEADVHGMPRSDRGLLTLKSKTGRAWLLDIFIKGNQPYVKIKPGTAELFRKEVEALLKSG